MGVQNLAILRLDSASGPLAGTGFSGGVNVITYNASTSACEKGQQWPEALVLLAQLPSRGATTRVTECRRDRDHNGVCNLR